MASQLIQDLRADMRLRGYSLATEKTYLLWIRRFIHFTGKQHPAEVDVSWITRYLTYLAAERHVSVNTQKVVLNSLVYLFEKFLKREVGELGFRLSSKQRSIPAVLGKSEVAKILSNLQGRNKLIIQLLYGSGLRVSASINGRNLPSSSAPDSGTEVSQGGGCGCRDYE